MPTDATALPDGLRRHLEVTYALERALGAGGMGVVWLGRDRMLDRLVAIKVMRADVAIDAESSSRFLQEARVAARLQHPSIVGLLSMGEVDGARYFVMPYVQGETLAARLSRGPLSEGEARKIFADIADALAHVHAQGVVHRDVKPANILLDRQSGLAKLADFGVAKANAATRLTATGMVVGTPAYLAPEQFLGDGAPIDGRADLYALGVVAYEMVAGSAPFSGATPHELMVRQATSTPPPLSERAPGVSAAYERVVMRCLARERDARWPSGDELTHILRSSDDGDPDPPELRPFRHAMAHACVIAFGLVAWGAIPLSSLFPDDGSLAGAHLAILAICAATPLFMAAGRIHQGIQSRPEGGITWGDALSVAMRVPPWWPLWWPRRWLSPVDRRRDLPAPVRSALRWWGVVFGSGAAMFGLIGLLLSTAAILGPDAFAVVRRSTAFGVLGLFISSVLPFVIPVASIPFVIGLWRSRKILGGVNGPKAQSLFASARGHEFWHQPWVRALLPDVGESKRAPESFDDLLAEVSELENRLVAEGWPLESISSVIRDARSAHAAWTREEAQLADEADPAEGNRLRTKLRALEDVRSPNTEQSELLDLLRRQLALHDRQRLRAEEAAARHERLRAGLMLLWRQLRALRLDDARRATATDLTGRVRGLADDIARLQQAAAETTPVGGR